MIEAGRKRQCNEEPWNQGLRTISRNWEKQGSWFSLRGSRVSKACQLLEFDSLKLIWDFWPQELQRICVYCFKLPSVWSFVTAAMGNIPREYSEYVPEFIFLVFVNCHMLMIKAVFHHRKDKNVICKHEAFMFCSI